MNGIVEPLSQRQDREPADLELWAGVECTVNRVGDTYFDQLEATGHAADDSQLERLIGLGVRTVRYPILWERTAPEGLAQASFALSDRRLACLREAGVRVIAGLVHHGSGPRHTSLVDRSFESGLAEFAGAVARRYPWIEDFTPVNEPLTTARFSGLYGHWYPHARSDRAFIRALLNQTRATMASMRAIREVSPGARFVQTEDIGRVFSTQALRRQAEFENERRWLSLDLLTGSVNAQHPLHRYLVTQGEASPEELARIAASPMPPDLIGLNYYVTSDRFLDERLSRYPASSHGSNGRERYADVEAVRVERQGIVGHCAALEAAHSRYRLPIAITEVHIGCTAEEQVRWLRDAWEGARAAGARGVDVRGVTLWSVFGSYDWDSLVTRRAGHYEPGAFDVRDGSIRETPLAAVARDLIRAGRSDHHHLAKDGWWNCKHRVLYSEPALDSLPTQTAVAS